MTNIIGRLFFLFAIFVICFMNNTHIFSQGEYLTKEGESLWDISIFYYGEGFYWPAIWDANKKIMPDPNIVPSGVYLKIPELTDAQIQEGKAKNKFKESKINQKINTDCQYFPLEKSLECTNNTHYIWQFNEYNSNIIVDKVPEYEKLEDPFKKTLVYEVKSITNGTIKDLSGAERNAVYWYLYDNKIEYIAASDEPYEISGFTFSSGFILMQFLDGYKKVFSIYSQESLEKIEKKEKVIQEKTVYQSFEVEIAPECVNLSQVRSSMTYPEIARKEGMEGRVTIKVLVGTDGNVIKVGSLSGPEVFHNVVRDKASNLEFNPGLQNGKPVKVWVTVPFNFNLK